MGGSDLKEFKVFIAGILRWLKMNCLLGETSVEMQVNYLGTHLTGEAQEWFYRNLKYEMRSVGCGCRLCQVLGQQFVSNASAQHEPRV